MASPQIIEKILQSDTLPTLPSVALEILNLTADNEVDLRLVAKILAQDASLTSKVLKFVNSPMIGFPQKIGTLAQAVSILGSDALRCLLLTFTLVNPSNRPQNNSFNYERFWERSLATGSAARLIAREAPGIHQEEAFFSGLLANIGEVFLAQAFPEAYCHSIQQCPGDPAEFCRREQEIFGIDHGEVGAVVAESWNIPEYFSDVMRHHSCPDNLTDLEAKNIRLAEIVHLAEMIADMFYAFHPAEIRDRFIERCQVYLGVSDHLYKDIAAKVHEIVENAAAQLGIRVQIDRSLEDILQQALQRVGEISLGYEARTRDMAKEQVRLSKKNLELEGKSQELEALANLDHLTQTFNQRYFSQYLCTEADRALRRKHELAMILADIDDFKPLNQTYGHITGDEILRQISQLMQSVLRTYDMLARYGGEEFVIVLPETNLAQAQIVAERIRYLVERHVFSKPPNEFRITISMGVTAFTPDIQRFNTEDFLALADRALLDAKALGKNRVIARAMQA
jgi:two-component system, cell cycle response regulator